MPRHLRSNFHRAWLIAGACFVFLVSLPSRTLAAGLSFEERVEAQRAIERVYYGHQQQATRPFDDVVTTDLLERKVRTQLKQSLLLERMWNTPVTAEALDAELRRIAGSTLLPERLKEIYEALDWDPVLVRETFVRAALVNRLSRSFFANDREIHAAAFEEAESIETSLQNGHLDIRGKHPRRAAITLHRQDLSEQEWSLLRSHRRIGTVEPLEERPESFVIRAVLRSDADSVEVATWSVPKRTWESWWQTMEPELDETLVQTVASAADLPMPRGSDITGPDAQALTVTCHPAGQWNNGSLDDLHPERRSHVAVWTGQVMLIWGGVYFSSTVPGPIGEKYDPLTDRWSALSDPIQSIGANNTAVWTGSEMILWGDGIGSRYDPVADAWHPVSTLGAPSYREEHSAVWTGSRMIIWGGQWSSSGPVNTGALYDPATDTWSPTSLAGAPAARYQHTAIWTGSRMVVWGGRDAGTAFDTGGRYDPTTNTWSGMTTLGAPTARSLHTAIWTGTRMIVWGGSTVPPGLTGGLYDPVNDSWATTAPAPETRWGHTAVWTGTEMIVWGGGASIESRTGARYDPATDQWRSVATLGAPGERSMHSAVWTGSQMIIWAGRGEYGESTHADGGRYDPATDRWTPAGLPSWRDTHSSVWTGTEMIVWGGRGTWDLKSLDTGARYDPLLELWTPTSRQGAPEARQRHSAVWTGSEMIVWGGFGAGGFSFATGGRYDPLTDTWTPTTTNGAPPGRPDPAAVWTGTRMIVWNGVGGSYDPASDTWFPISNVGDPPGRNLLSTVWTGREMIIWGGLSINTTVNTGGRYDPALDTWRPTSLIGVPQGRQYHGSVWTGSEMIVFGGNIIDAFGSHITNTGGRYHPDTDTWRPTSQTGAPSNYKIVSVWTGTRMLNWGSSQSGAYHPASNTWGTVEPGGPDWLDGYSAVWDGGGMIVWGYTIVDGQALGGRYVPGPDLSVDTDVDGATVCAGDCNDSDPAVRPGGAQICDGKNNDCSHPSWPALTSTNEADGDGDGLSTCAGDCLEGNASVWLTPSETPNLQLSGDVVSWDAPSQPGAASVRYDTLRAAVANDFVSGTTCVESDDGADLSAVDLQVPPPGSVFYYLTRAENNCPGIVGSGPLGTSSSGSPQAGRPCP